MVNEREIINEVTNTDNLKVETYEDLVDELLFDLNSIIDDCKVDATIFQSKTNNFKELSKAINKLEFDERIIDFFNLLLAEYKIVDFNETEVQFPNEKVIKKFLSYFCSDLKMLLLKESVVNISNYFYLNYDNHGDSDVAREMFYDFTSFKSKMLKYALEMELSESDIKGLTFTIEEYKEKIHYKIPKIAFPWYAYALCDSYKEFPAEANDKKIFIINGSCSSLKWTGRSLYSERNINVEDAQKNFKKFIKSLSEMRSQEEDKINESLNLNLFNEITNLYDLYNLNKIFNHSSHYMKIKRMNIKSKESDKRSQQRKKEVFAGVSHIAPLKHIGTKTYLINGFYKEDIFSNGKIWSTLDKIINYYKERILVAIQIPYNSESTLPEHIQKDYYIYCQIKEDRPYSEFLKVLTKKTLPVYLYSDSGMNKELYDSYFYLYQGFYEKQFKGSKSKNYIKY
ncbi:hypothetical protein [Planococcus halotolerans]|uniref:hypothetical protein n=1 Tax=Planococcus halotolerans TaxID=2233542 RepID=UPI0010923273|nr:hypothetical protein [Planococcus halotolerans]QHJ69225.1 hypothetical protein DNR44_000575 [Planococcus halotolerans]